MKKNLFWICVFISNSIFCQTINISPNNADLNESLVVNFSGTNTNFSQGNSTFWLSQGSSTINSNGSTINSDTDADVNFTIPSNVNTGYYDVNYQNSTDGVLQIISGFLVNATSALAYTYDVDNGKQLVGTGIPITSAHVRLIPSNIGGGLYTVEVNTASDFTGTSWIKTGTNLTNSSFDFFFTNMPLATTFYVRVSVDGGLYGTTQTFRTAAGLGFSHMNYVNDAVNGSQQVGMSVHPTTETSVYILPRKIHGASQYTVEISDSSTFGAGTVSQTKVGTSHSKLNYQFTGLPNARKIYVRVMTDLDGTFGRVKYFITKDAISPFATRSSSFSEEDVISNTASYSMYPNPFTHNFYIRVDTDDDEKLAIKISDLTGKVVFESSNYTTNQNIKLGSTLKNGMYLMQLIHNEDSKLIKMIKK